MAISAGLCDNTERLGAGNTVSGITFGAASAERLVVVLVLTTDATIIAATIGGVTAVAAQIDIGATRMALCWAMVPTGTSGNLVLTGANPLYSAGAYACYGADSTFFAANGTVGASTTVNTAAGGAVIAFSIRAPAAGVAWPVLGEDFDRVIAGGGSAGTANFSGAHLDPTTAQTPMTVTATGAGAVVAVSFKSAPAVGKLIRGGELRKGNLIRRGVLARKSFWVPERRLAA